MFPGGENSELTYYGACYPRPLSPNSLRARQSIQGTSVEHYWMHDLVCQCDDETWRQCVQESYKEDAYHLAPWKGWKDYSDVSGYGYIKPVFECDLRNAPRALFHPSRFLGNNTP